MCMCVIIEIFDVVKGKKKYFGDDREIPILLDSIRRMNTYIYTYTSNQDTND